MTWFKYIITKNKQPLATFRHRLLKEVGRPTTVGLAAKLRKRKGQHLEINQLINQFSMVIFICILPTKSAIGDLKGSPPDGGMANLNSKSQSDGASQIFPPPKNTTYVRIPIELEFNIEIY
jgi:hypothetical protein